LDDGGPGRFILAPGHPHGRFYAGYHGGGKMKATSRRWSAPGEPLTPFQINQIAFAVPKGIAHPDDAKRLIAHFCDLVESRKPLPPRLIEHFREAFTAYIDGTKSLEAALGVKRRKGHPHADEKQRIEMATEVMRQRLAEQTHEQALIRTAQKFNCAETIISEAWRAHKLSALDLVIENRDRNGDQFTAAQKKVLQRILHDMPRLNHFGKITD
jgi:hypothetical protein